MGGGYNELPAYHPRDKFDVLCVCFMCPSRVNARNAFKLSYCKIRASLFLSSSGPHAMVQEAFLTTKDSLIVRRFCACQVEIFN